MNWQKLNDWLQVFGLLGVIASLVFVGLQMKQTQEIALAATYNERAAMTVEIASSVQGSPKLISALSKLYSGQRGSLTAEEYTVLEYLANAELTNIENNHFQYENGFLPPEHWEKNLAVIECMMSEPFFRDVGGYWDARVNFRKVLDEAIEKGRRAERSCWVSHPDDPWPYFNPLPQAAPNPGAEPPAGQ